jgi:hypothetical protein
MTTNIFDPNHIDMVIAGHSHFYQHNFLNGIHHMVIGAGGGPLQDPTNESYTVKSVKDYNWATIDVTPSQFFMTVYNDSNKMLDTIRLIKNPGYIHHEGNNVDKYELFQNYPNPFNPTTIIRFGIPSLEGYVRPGGRGVGVTLKIFDISGRELQTLINERLQPGTYETTFDGSAYTSGIYFYKLQTGDYSETKKLILLK